MADAVAGGLAHLRRTTDWVAATMAGDPDAVLAVATPSQRLFGTVAGGWQMLRQARGARGDDAFMTAKRASAAFYMKSEMPLAGAYAAMVGAGPA